MTKKIVFILLVLPIFTFAQVTVEVPAEYVNNQATASSIDVKNYKGSPYLDETFVLGKILFNNAKNIPARLRYNAYSDEFEFYDRNKISALLKLDNTKIVLGDKLFVLKKIDDNGIIRKGYFQELVKKGSIKLYKKLYKKFMEAKKATSSYGADKPARFETKFDYFIERNDNLGLRKLNLKKKEIIKTLQDKDTAIKKFIKSNSLKLSREPDLIKLFTYYNTL
jgi:hypothetical protein